MAELKAVIFDQDGVIADTEKDGHRVAFNKAFQEFNFDIEWDVETYGKLIKIGGGKERIRHYLLSEGLDKNIKDIDTLIKKLHKRKTEILTEIIKSGQLSLRSGVRRLIIECHDADIRLGLCTTASEEIAHALLETLLGDQIHDWFDLILAGDVVSRKKPDPEIYKLARERLKLSSEDCIVIEDSRIGLLAAKGSGMRCIITINEYTKDHIFSEADMVVTCLGDKDGEKSVLLSGGRGLSFSGLVTIQLLQKIMGADN